MGLTKLVKINDNSAWALWKLEESEEEMLDQIKSKHLEKEYFAEIKHRTKRLEWLGGRLATKYLLDTYKENFKGIVKDKYGKPYLPDSNFHISFAHSYPFAAAIIHKDKPVGIDLELPKEKLLFTKQKFLSKKELDFAGEDVHKICIYWCAKECLFKILGKKKISFKENLFIEPFGLKDEFLNATIEVEDQIHYFQLQHLIIKNYQLVYNI